MCKDFVKDGYRKFRYYRWYEMANTVVCVRRVHFTSMELMRLSRVATMHVGIGCKHRKEISRQGLILKFKIKFEQKVCKNIVNF